MNVEAPARTNWFDLLVLILLVFLIIDLALFGPGIVLPVLGVTARRLVFVGIFGLFILRHILSARAMTVAQLLLLATVACITVIWTVAIPSAYGFAVSDSLADVLPWTSLLLLVFWPWDAWPSVSKWIAFSQFIVRISLLLAAIHIAVWALLVSGVISNSMLSLVTYGLTGGDPSDDSFIKVAAMAEENRHRVYWSSSIFMLCGLYFLVANGRTGSRIWWVIRVGLLAFALWITQIRGFLGAAAIFVALAPVLRFMDQPLLSGRNPVGVLLIWVVFVLSVSAAINPSLLQSIGLSRDVSDVARVEQAEALLAAFSAHPFFGTGFGSYSTALVRSSEVMYSYELVFYALLMKLGLVGLGAISATLLLSLNVVRLDEFARLNPVRHSYWVAFTAGFWFAGATNPLAVNFVGMAVLLLLLIDARYFSERLPAC
jgi:hypothetical protein